MKKKTKIILLIITILLLTGCTKQFKDANGKVVTTEETKQTLVSNVICKPQESKNEYEKAFSVKEKELNKKYKKGDISKNQYNKNIKSLKEQKKNFKKLPSCTSFTPLSNGYETFWTTFFVKPLAWIIVKVGQLVGNIYGLSIIIVTLIIKLILVPFSNGSLKQSEKMQKIQPKLKKIEKKYANKTDQESMMMKSNEMMALYKENGIKPLSGCLLAFIQLPLFFAFYEALYRLPIVFEGKFIGFHMGMTPLAGAQEGNWYYLVLPILVGLVTFFSFKMNKNTMPSGDQQKSMNMMFNIMIVMIFITSFSMSTAIIIYWVVNSLFTIIQNLIVKRRKTK